MKYMVTVSWVICLTMICIAIPVRADEGGYAVVVMVNDKEIVFDKGERTDIQEGDTVGLYRTITVHHPVTGKDITDKFPIGDVKVGQVSELLSIITNFKKLSHPPKVGDLVRLYKWEEKQKAIAAAVEADKSDAEKKADLEKEKQESQVDPEMKDLMAVMKSGLGRTINKRIAHYKWFIQKYPHTKYMKKIVGEITWLNTLKKQMAKPKIEQNYDDGEKEKLKVLHPRISYLEVGDEVQFVIAAVPPHLVKRAHLYLMGPEDDAFEQVEMIHEGVYYYRVHLPKRYVSNIGRFNYFIETASPQGATSSVAGNEKRPLSVVVKAPVVDNNVRQNRSETRAVFEYVDFDIDKNVDDQYWSFEADFFYRLKSRALYGVRVGTGYFKGTGGNLSEIEESNDNNQQLAALYGYVEGEFEILPLFHFMIRGLAGNQRSPDDDSSESAGVFGLEGGIRIGEEMKTNLVLAGAIFEDIGYEGRLSFEINQFRKIPITIEGLVTSFPVTDSNLGMRIVVGAGYRFSDRFAVLARASWNARTITHTGIGAGASMALSW